MSRLETWVLSALASFSAGYILTSTGVATTQQLMFIIAIPIIGYLAIGLLLTTVLIIKTWMSCGEVEWPHPSAYLVTTLAWPWAVGLIIRTVRREMRRRR